MQAWSMLRWSLAQRGVSGTLRAALGKVMHGRGQLPVPAFDRRYGVDTGGLIGGGRLVTGSKDDIYNASYYGSPPSLLRGGLARWQQLLGGDERVGDFSFVDLGCGKGRAVLVASEYGFRRVVGVELHPGLKRVAEENLTRWRQLGKPSDGVELMAGSATEYSFPDGPCIIYMYNPFAGPVVKSVLANIEKQFAERSDRLDVLYLKPVEAEFFDANLNFRLLWSGVLPMSEEDRATDVASLATEPCCIYRYSNKQALNP